MKRSPGNGSTAPQRRSTQRPIRTRRVRSRWRAGRQISDARNGTNAQRPRSRGAGRTHGTRRISNKTRPHNQNGRGPGRTETVIIEWRARAQTETEQSSAVAAMVTTRGKRYAAAERTTHQLHNGTGGIAAARYDRSRHSYKHRHRAYTEDTCLPLFSPLLLLLFLSLLSGFPSLLTGFSLHTGSQRCLACRSPNNRPGT